MKSFFFLKSWAFLSAQLLSEHAKKVNRILVLPLIIWLLLKKPLNYIDYVQYKNKLTKIIWWFYTPFLANKDHVKMVEKHRPLN